MPRLETFGDFLAVAVWIPVVAVFGTILFFLVKAWIKR